MRISSLSRSLLSVGFLAILTGVPAPTQAAPFAYVPDARDNTVSVVDTATTTVVATIPVAAQPLGVAVNATGTTVYVTHSYGANLVSVIDTASNAVSATIEVGENPQGIAVNHAETRVYVANVCGQIHNCGYPSPPGTVSVIDTASNTVIATIPVGQGPFGVAVNPIAPRAYVSNSGDGTLSIIDTEANSVVATLHSFAEPAGVAVSRDGTRLHVADVGRIVSFPLEFQAFQGAVFIPVNGSPPATPLYGIALSPSGTTAYVTDRYSDLFAVDLSTGATSQFVVAPPSPFPPNAAWGVSVTPDGHYVYVANPPLSTVSIVDPTANYCGDHTCTPIPSIMVGSGPIAFGQFIAPSSACFGLSDGTSCDDGNACTSGDTCAGGICVGTPVSGTACDDLNPCTVNDTCSDGVCAGTAMSGSLCFEGSDICSAGTCTNGVCARLCGNGIVDPGEQCDDGTSNGTPGSCCSVCCQVSCTTTTTSTSTTTTTTTSTTIPRRIRRSARRAAVAFQINPAHTGFQRGHLIPPLSRRWAVDLGGPVSYPLIAEGKVFAIVGGVMSSPSRTALCAFDEETGAEAWGPIPIPGSTAWSALAYDRGRIFVINFNDVLTAYEAETGAMAWSVRLPGQLNFSAAPTAADGIVFVGGAENGGTLYAVDERDGSVLWTASVENGDNSSPAVSPAGVYVSYTCEQAYGFEPRSGILLWHYNPFRCEGGGGRTPVLYGGRLYVRDLYYSAVVLDAQTGESLGSFPFGQPPAFHRNREFSVHNNIPNSVLEARDVTTGNTLWTFPDNGVLDVPPIVVNGTVYVGSFGGTLHAVSERTGKEKWATNVGAIIVRSDESTLTSLLTGLAAGGHSLVVPASNLLVAYR